MKCSRPTAHAIGPSKAMPPRWPQAATRRVTTSNSCATGWGRRRWGAGPGAKRRPRPAGPGRGSKAPLPSPARRWSGSPRGSWSGFAPQQIEPLALRQPERDGDRASRPQAPARITPSPHHRITAPPPPPPPAPPTPPPRLPAPPQRRPGPLQAQQRLALGAAQQQLPALLVKAVHGAQGGEETLLQSAVAQTQRDVADQAAKAQLRVLQGIVGEKPVAPARTRGAGLIGL